jgi:5-methylcytosine-specific restriction endonuclease McrA
VICNYCGQEFTPKHFNQRLCSAECKTLAIKRAKAQYKQTDKGRESNAKWVTSERRKANEKQYRSTPERRHALVLAQARYIKTHPETRERRRQRDRLYWSSERGRSVNLAATARYRRTEKGTIIRRITKARRRGAIGNFTAEQWSAKCAEFGGKCAHCGATERLEIDHIKPIALGGTNTIDNVQPLCRHCNSSKGARFVG